MSSKLKLFQVTCRYEFDLPIIAESEAELRKLLAEADDVDEWCSDVDWEFDLLDKLTPIIKLAARTRDPDIVPTDFEACMAVKDGELVSIADAPGFMEKLQEAALEAQRKIAQGKHQLTLPLEGLKPPGE
jgi:hypothetical protein